MTIQEAIKSGKPFIRNVHLQGEFTRYWRVSFTGRIVADDDQDINKIMYESDILADDWEIKP